MITGQVRKGAYFDSVTLMRVGKEITSLPGVIDAALVMGTKSNKAILDSSGLHDGKFKDAGDTDLIIAVKAKDEPAAKDALAAVDALLKKRPPTESRSASLKDANLALISIAGRYAGDEAMRALEAGMHVMLFSDNVPLEKEIALKKFAAKRGLLVMGPDCGTAIINGVPLAFANVVNRGNIGIVAAAGTGLQEVSCIISNAGAGISQAIGTGGRDVKKEVGGIMFIEGLKALAKDEQTKVILLVSKPPHPAVLKKIKNVLKTIRKPVVTMFIGASPGTLEDAALQAVGLKAAAVRQKIPKPKKGQKYIRGLFSGGTFCAEAQILLPNDAYSNAPTGKSKQLKNSLKSQKNTFLDLGEDEFTVGRPHPMIDYSLRNKRIIEEAADRETAVILLDVVLGYGSHPDPASELTGVIREASRKVAVVCSITGTNKDPQNRSRVAAALKKAGAIVMPSNAAACKLAGSIVQCR
jgi:FdrA protein